MCVSRAPGRKSRFVVRAIDNKLIYTPRSANGEKLDQQARLTRPNARKHAKRRTLAPEGQQRSRVRLFECARLKYSGRAHLPNARSERSRP